MAYAKHECADCGYLLGADEMVRIEETVRSGTSKSFRHRGSSPFLWHSGTTKHYSNRSKWLCPACSRKRIVRNLLILLAVGLFLTWAVLSNERKKRTRALAPVEQIESVGTEPAYSAQDQYQPVDETSEVNDAPSVEEIEASPGDQAPSPAETPTAPPVAQPAVPDLTAQVLEVPSAVDAVREAMQAAMLSGQAERWKVGKLHGYAVPSTPGPDGCRMVQVSIDQGGAQSTAQKLCPEGE